MAFAIPEGLAPEIAPLAWLLGTWRGPGFLAYPGIPERPFVQEASFGHNGGAYLTYESTTWLLDEVTPARLAGPPDEADRAGGLPSSTPVEYAPGAVWAAESGYWRALPRPAGSSTDAPAELEVVIAEPSGHVSVYLGSARGPRVEIATDLVARTSTAADVSALHRMFGLVDGELMWATDMAAFGHELRSYASARLDRVAGPAQ